MAYRSTKEKDNARAIARQLYIKKGLSLEDIHQRTGETLKTLRTWRKLGQWEPLRDNSYNPALELLMDELHEHNPDLARAVGPPLTRLGDRIFSGELAAIMK